MYDYYLGGKDNYPADRELAQKVLAVVPQAQVAAQANRAFLRRAVRYLVINAGIRQILDIGTGLPTAGNVHEIAQEIDPSCRVVYVDNDPVVMAHAVDLLHGSDDTAFIKHDLRDPGDILDDAELRKLIDFGMPVAVLLLAVVHFIADEDNPRGIIQQLLDAFPPGSFLAMSHGTGDRRPEVLANKYLYDHATSPYHPRTQSEVHALVDGLDLVEPGVVWLPEWRPDANTAMRDCPEQSLCYAVVGHKE